mmetsp:Transcript_7928/g.9002  ORF Transcript_7928/g.9002 Transcript_7928/m.9002 type:complete len:136 (+) Transcript_7928:1-408(+)
MESSECRKLKIICLHGIYNNIRVMKYQMDYYEYIFRDVAEFHYVQAEKEHKEVFDKQIQKKFKGDRFYSWMYQDENNSYMQSIIDSTHRVAEYMNQHGPFDGCIGFSQGGFILRCLLKAAEIPFKIAQPLHTPSF